MVGNKQAIILLISLLVLAGGARANDIHGAAQEGDLARVKALLAEEPALASALCGGGGTPLHAAIVGGHWNVADLLLQADPKLIEVKDALGLSPLNLAALHGRTGIVGELLAKGASLETGDRENSQPLHNAAARGHRDTAAYLVKKGADVAFADDNGTTPLHFAASSGDLDLVRLFVEHGADVNMQNFTQGMVPLHWAASRESGEIVEYLLDRGASIDVRDLEGRTPLFHAVQNWKTPMVRLLIGRGADIDMANYRGETPLLTALHGHKQIAELLLEKGADVKAEAEGGWTALHNAAFGGLHDIAALLLEKGLDVNAATETGWTPLFAAANRGRSDICKLFVKAGARVDVARADGRSLLHEMVVKGENEIAGLLIGAGAEVNKHDPQYGRNALHWAAIKGESAMADLLLANGAAVNGKDASGLTPLDLAGKYGNKDTADLLLSRKAEATTKETNFGRCGLLDKELDEKQAVLWYLGHCGWAIKTKAHFLVFDYWENGPTPDQPCLANGHIDPDELEGIDLHVFATHEHGDHFDPTIFWWHRALENVTYILGWEPRQAPAYTYTAPRTTHEIDGMKVTTIAANDSGVGFLVEVDGLTLYHAGDHAGWREGEREGYTREIDFLAEKFPAVDIAFLNITGCHAHDPAALAEGTAYTLQKLPARMMVPTHAGDREYLYEEYAQKAIQEKWKTEVICPENRGDCFVFGRSSVD